MWNYDRETTCFRKVVCECEHNKFEVEDQKQGWQSETPALIKCLRRWNQFYNVCQGEINLKLGVYLEKYSKTDLIPQVFLFKRVSPLCYRVPGKSANVKSSLQLFFHFHSFLYRFPTYFHSYTIRECTISISKCHFHKEISSLSRYPLLLLLLQRYLCPVTAYAKSVEPELYQCIIYDI